LRRSSPGVARVNGRSNMPIWGRSDYATPVCAPDVCCTHPDPPCPDETRRALAALVNSIAKVRADADIPSWLPSRQCHVRPDAVGAVSTWRAKRPASPRIGNPSYQSSDLRDWLRTACLARHTVDLAVSECADHRNFSVRPTRLCRGSTLLESLAGLSIAHGSRPRRLNARGLGG